MRLFKGSDERAYSTARRRLQRVRGDMVHNWAETSLWAVQEGLEGGRSDRAGLEQARIGIIGLLAAVDDLLDREP